MEIITTLVIALLILLVFWFFRQKGTSDTRPLPGPRPYPVIGNVLQMDTEKLHLQLSTWAKQYGPIFQVKIFGKTIISINDAATARKAFSSQEYGKSFNDRPRSFFGKYIFFNFSDLSVRPFDKLTSHLRKTVTQALHTYGDGIKEFENIVRTEMVKFIKNVEETKGQNTCPDHLVSQSFANILAVLLTGEVAQPGDADIIWEFNNALDPFIQPGFDMTMSTFPFLRLLPLSVFGRKYRRVMKSRDTLLKRFYQQSKDTYVSGKQRGIVDVFLKMQEDVNGQTSSKLRISDSNVCCLVIDIVFAGLMTTKNGILSWLVILLNNQDCIKRIQNEIDREIGRDRLPMIADKSRMPYTESAMIECLRLASHIPTSLIHVPSKDVDFDGYLIKKNSNILLNIWHVQHDEATWDDPWLYKPERFLDADGQVVSQEHKLRQNILSFSIGRRNCVGEFMGKSRMFLYITSLLQSFDLRQPENEPEVDADPRHFAPGIVIGPYPFKCRLRPRK